MDLATITEDPHVARRKFLEYRNAVRNSHQAQDEAIMRGYRQLAKGAKLIRLSDTIHAGGITTVTVPVRWDRTRKVTMTVPRLAVVRGGSEYAWTLGIDRGGDLEMRGKEEISDRNQRDRINISGFEPVLGERRRLRAMTPLIPPLLRPADRVSNYHILWEAEWALDPVPPVDPALLKHIGGDLYAVVAVWDLTDLERAVLAHP